MNEPLRIIRDGDAEEAALQAERIAEALLFASAEPLGLDAIAAALPYGIEPRAVLARLGQRYEGRGVSLRQVAGKWQFVTAPDLGHLLARETREPRKLSRAALETLAIIAYHQPATRAEIEEIRGVATAKGTLDLLMEAGWVRMRGRRRSPGRPVTYGTTDAFLVHFGLNTISDLPGIEELKGTGLIEGRLPDDFEIPLPSDDPSLQQDEDPLGPDLFDALAEERSAEIEPDLDPDDDHDRG
jgi:segregation and condensation protein B